MYCNLRLGVFDPFSDHRIGVTIIFYGHGLKWHRDKLGHGVNLYN